MRLLEAETLEIIEFAENKIPAYAILSHTWGDKEVSFEDMQSGRADGKAGLAKIKRCSEKAAASGYGYIWVDTCCIDKRSSAELSEAINSMYRWYQNAETCYAYLADVVAGGHSLPSFRKSRWFMRGWTLQELLAPGTVEFYDSGWRPLGNKLSLGPLLSSVTGIDRNVIQGEISIWNVSVAQRMSWASKRQTTRVEDIAYCLMGLFDVNMPLLYGEGERAFLRLEEAIMEVSDDQTLFAWASEEISTTESNNPAGRCGLLASSPAQFARSSDYVRSYNPRPTQPYVMTNKGLRIELLLSHAEESDTDFEDQELFVAVLECQFGASSLSRMAIYLEKTFEAENLYVRVRPWNIKRYAPGMTLAGSWETIYVRQKYTPGPSAVRWGLIVARDKEGQYKFSATETYGIWQAQSRTLWSRRSCYGKLGAIAYHNLDDEWKMGFVVVVGMATPSRVWCSIEVGIFSFLRGYLDNFVEEDHLSNLAETALPGDDASIRVVAEIKPTQRQDEKNLFILNISIVDDRL